MDTIDTQDTQRERSGRDLLTWTQQNKRKNTYTQQNFTTHVEETMPIGVWSNRATCWTNENVRVDEDSLTDKDVRVKRSDRGSRSLRGPMEVPVEERLWSRHVGSTCKALSHGRAILCYPVRDVRRVKCDEQGSNVIMMLCRGHKCNCESIHMHTCVHVDGYEVWVSVQYECLRGLTPLCIYPLLYYLTPYGEWTKI